MTFEGLACRPNAKFAPRSAAAGPSLSGSGGSGRSGGRPVSRAGRHGVHPQHSWSTTHVRTLYTERVRPSSRATAGQHARHATACASTSAAANRRRAEAVADPGHLVRREAMARAPRSRALRLLGSARLQSTGLLSAADEHMRASPTTRRLAARPVVTSLDGVVESVDPHGKRGR